MTTTELSTLRASAVVEAPISDTMRRIERLFEKHFATCTAFSPEELRKPGGKRFLTMDERDDIMDAIEDGQPAEAIMKLWGISRESYRHYANKVARGNRPVR